MVYFELGELVKGLHAVKARDVDVGANKNKLMFVLHTSKTHNKGVKPQVIKIKSIHSDKNAEHKQNMKYCPFNAIKQYVQIRQKYVGDEKFFVFRDRSLVTQYQSRAVLAQAIAHNRLDPSHYSSQGFCAGRSSDLLDLGLSVKQSKN